MSYSVNLKLAQVNLNSLVNKTNYVFNFLCVHNVDCFGISETWLTPETPDSYLSLPGYIVARSDNPHGIRKHGVAVYVRVGIKFTVVDCNVNNVLFLHLHDYNIFVVIEVC